MLEHAKSNHSDKTVLIYTCVTWFRSKHCQPENTVVIFQINWLIRRETADGIVNVRFVNSVCPIQITVYDYYSWSSAVLYSYDLTKHIICYLSSFVYYRRRLSSFSLLTTRRIRICRTFFSKDGNIKI